MGILVGGNESLRSRGPPQGPDYLRFKIIGSTGGGGPPTELNHARQKIRRRGSYVERGGVIVACP